MEPRLYAEIRRPHPRRDMDEPHQGTASVLQDLFDAMADSDVRRFVDQFDRKAGRDLPGAMVSPNELARAAVDVMMRRKMLTTDALEWLAARHPALTDQIAALASATGIGLRSKHQLVPSPPRAMAPAFAVLVVACTLAVTWSIGMFGRGAPWADESVVASRVAGTALSDPQDAGERASVQSGSPVGRTPSQDATSELAARTGDAEPPTPEPDGADEQTAMMKDVPVPHVDRWKVRPVEPSMASRPPPSAAQLWTVSRVGSVQAKDGKRISLTGPGLKAGRMLRLQTPVADGRTFVHAVDCRIEPGPPPWCMLVAIPGNPGLQVGDVLELRPEPPKSESP